MLSCWYPKSKIGFLCQSWLTLKTWVSSPQYSSAKDCPVESLAWPWIDLEIICKVTGCLWVCLSVVANRRTDMVLFIVKLLKAPYWSFITILQEGTSNLNLSQTKLPAQTNIFKTFCLLQLSNLSPPRRRADALRVEPRSLVKNKNKIYLEPGFKVMTNEEPALFLAS